MDKKQCHLFIFAGEKSGDLHGGHLLRELFALYPHLHTSGVGGPSMRAQGLECLLSMEDFQVMGFVDVFFALPRLARQFYLIKNFILREQPSVVLLIDYPGFNLRLAAGLRKAGFQGHICHYICPSVWAWGKKRIPHMARTLDTLFSILPFEKSFFQNTSLPVHYVGHPLVAAIHRFSYEPLHCFSEGKILSLFPGSRHKEIERNLFLQLSTAKKMEERDSSLQIGVSVAHASFLPLIRHHIKKAGLNESKVRLIPLERNYDLMRISHLAIATSGTITLELALHGIPTVVTYDISPIDLFIARRILRIHLPFYCLVNILSNEEVFPELIGPRLNEETLFEAIKTLFGNPVLYTDCREKCFKIQALLGTEDASRAIVSYLETVIKCTKHAFDNNSLTPDFP